MPLILTIFTDVSD